MRSLYFKFMLFALFLSLIVMSCKKESSNPDDNIPEDSVYVNIIGDSIYIVNQGNMGSMNGSISLYDPKDSLVQNNLFETANPGKKTGDVVQSMGIANNKGYILVNNNHLIKVVSLPDFVQVAEIEVGYPRNFLQINEKIAYVTCSGEESNFIAIIDLTNNSAPYFLTTGNGPENLVKCGQFVYVANSGGWYATDSTVSVINSGTTKVIKQIVVGENPTDLVCDADSNIWVICKGYYDNNWKNGESKLVKINHESKEVEKSFIVGTAFDDFETSLLTISKDLKTIYFNERGGVYAFKITDSALPANPLISTGKLYGLDVNPQNGDIYCMYSGDFVSAGKVEMYDKDGNKKNEFSSGIGPCQAVFW
jgi:YVTN family beta-propeller protein